MTDAVTVRRVRLEEWREVRRLRVEAVSDPDAAIAFLSTAADEQARDAAFWQERTAGAALSDAAAQFVAIVDDTWVGTATVLVRAPGEQDHLDRDVAHRRADVVGVYVAPRHRGSGILALLFDAIADWARARDVDALTLDVHAHNARAQAAYRKTGFLPTGETLASTIGPELVMRRPV
ncbi:GNAT family N-acetyltransferase [Microbacterium ulmi]|uniref:GNAT family N-acetyltransferase n=1 Tax=Microbacterium ulmi TaxID=179095 RepID=A0A7Y2PZB6_9MICO|nr:GNAT family N-acetyltransferase [Microbacterium ulmi]NII70963.1 GNAT superfamily N-acetyltransferase [Microbacterium ulmi]NNH04271.1 GNAT family N-acetyltransferase [Microbacterium ulmi]